MLAASSLIECFAVSSLAELMRTALGKGAAPMLRRIGRGGALFPAPPHAPSRRRASALSSTRPFRPHAGSRAARRRGACASHASHGPSQRRREGVSRAPDLAMAHLSRVELELAVPAGVEHGGLLCQSPDGVDSVKAMLHFNYSIK